MTSSGYANPRTQLPPCLSPEQGMRYQRRRQVIRADKRGLGEACSLAAERGIDGLPARVALWGRVVVT